MRHKFWEETIISRAADLKAPGSAAITQGVGCGTKNSEVSGVLGDLRDCRDYLSRSGTE